ncbi:DEAD/DEAH box helicase [Butyricicoccus faecihominis]|uniref:DEAD/DEAH box helicase n=1 Tax=Butyricicoccus faecihominis TaxID=1712515 RepID=A0ABQ1E1Q8_9FIRM|nr:DEAD/DEAH box helicase [Butyricicoccus faecihominis]GGM76047.1 DEAD/DEAH box helicase [Butyricicoccus faecihominis]
MYDRFEVNKVLVVAPLRVAEDTWTKESAKWDHLRGLRVVRVLGSQAQRIRALETDADIYCINRENIPWLVKYYGTEWPFDGVVLDELSSFKSPSSKRFKAMRKVRPLIKHIVGLTGTPSPNGLIDLWAQIYLLDQGKRLGRTLTEYRNRYFNPGRRNGYVVYDWVPKDGAEDEIYRRISDICISMKACDYLKLPERVDVVRTVKLDDEAQTAYTEMEKEAVLELGPNEIVDAGTAAVVSGKLLQIANGAVYDENGKTHIIHESKLDTLEDVIEAVNGRPVLVFYAYQHDLERIMQRFPQARKLEGSAEIDAWNRGEIPILLAHPAGAGHGLNLQAGGNHIVWFGLTWSLELYQQANARIYRQGVKGERVTITHLVTEGTIDEDVMRVLDGKATRQDALLEAVKARVEKYQSNGKEIT